MAQLLHYHLRRAKETVFIVTLSGYTCTWEECWKRQTGIDWDKITNTKTPVYIIIDEVPKSYPASSSCNGLWGFIKNAVARQLVNYLCIGSYGDNAMAETPVEIKAVVTLHPHGPTPGLAYTEQEFMALCKLFEERGGFNIDDRSANYIFHMTGGHAGITGWILGSMHQFSKSYESGAKAAEELYDYLHSTNFHYSLRNSTCRAIPNFKKQDWMGNVCKIVLDGEEFKAPKTLFEDDEELDNNLKTCLKASILAEDGDNIAFASPIVQDRALAYYFHENRADPPNLHSFLTAVVQRFSSHQLRNTKGRDSKSRIMEGEWQHEFSRAAASLLPADAVLSSEHGRELGVKGQVDFYISKYKWLLEVLWDGIALPAHERRFAANGRYAPLLAHKDWAVADFRSAAQNVRRDPHPTVYHVSFSEDFVTVIIRDPAGLQQEVPLRGDQAMRMQTSGSTPLKLRLT